jgi:hypothetical protein
LAVIYKAEDPKRVTWSTFLRRAAEERAVIYSDYFYEADLARRGVFVYRAHTDRFNIAEPYGRLLTPFRPLIVGDVPRPLGDQLAKRVHLDVSFASASYIQPAELVPCGSWTTEAYLASDGFTLRPMPGVERADYLELAADLRESSSLQDREIFKPLVFDPPLDQ